MAGGKRSARRAPPFIAGGKGVAEYAGFSLHAGIGIEPDAREKVERLCRYVSRPAIAAERLSLTPQGDVHFRLKTPYRDGTTHIVLEPLDFMARLQRSCRRRACIRRAITACSPRGAHCGPR